MLVPCTSIPEWLTRWRGSIGSRRAAFHTVGVDTEESEAREVTGVPASHYGMPFAMKEDHRKIKTNNKRSVQNMMQTLHATV